MLTVTCECGARFRIKDELAGKKGKCPKCGRIIALVERELQIIEANHPDPAPPPGRGNEDQVCPACGARIPHLSFSCEFCGASLKKETAMNSTTGLTPGTSSELGDSPEKLIDAFAAALPKINSEGLRLDDDSAQMCRGVLIKLRAFASKDRGLSRVVEDLQAQYDRLEQEILIREKKDNEDFIKWGLPILGIVVIVIVVIVILNKVSCAH